MLQNYNADLLRTHELHWHQSRRHLGALVGLAPPKQSSKTPKLKHEAQYISGDLVNF